MIQLQSGSKVVRRSSIMLRLLESGVPKGKRTHHISTQVNHTLSTCNYRDSIGSVINYVAFTQIRLKPQGSTALQASGSKVVRNNGPKQCFGSPKTYRQSISLTQVHQRNTDQISASHGGDMARINIEDSLFKDRRYLAFVVKIGDPTLALGAFVEACIVAQEFFLEESTKGMIPISVWEDRGLRNEIIENGLADVLDDFVKLKGSDESFAWLKRAQKAGTASAESRQRKSTEVNASRPLTLTPTLPLTLSPVLTPSLSRNTQISNSSNSSTEAKDFIAGYCDRFKLRYHFSPDIKGKEAGIAKRLVKDVSLTKLFLYLDAFFAMPDAGLVKAKHPLNLFELKLNEISVFANTGTFHTNREVRQADDGAANALLLAKIRRGEV